MATKDELMEQELDAVGATASEVVETPAVSDEEKATLAELRKIEGTKDFDDAALLKMHKTAQAKAAAPKRSYKLYKDDQEVADIEKMTASDLLGLKFGYTALGKEQRKSLDEMVRVASYGHYNEQKVAGLQAERQQAYEALKTLEKEHEQWGGDRKTWERALAAFAQGNVEPMQQLAAAYAAAANAPEVADETPTAESSEVAGMQVYYQYVVPNAYRVAQQYGADANEVAAAVMQLVDLEPTEFLTQEKLDSIINIEIPALLEQNGYNVNGAAPAAKANGTTDELAALQAQVAKLTAELENNKVTSAKRKSPPAGAGVSATAGDTMPEFKNRREMKEWLISS